MRKAGQNSGCSWKENTDEDCEDNNRNKMKNESMKIYEQHENL